MEKTQWTPGPWYWERDDPHSPVTGLIAGEDEQVLWPNFGTLAFGIDGDRHLIAAAPDLAAALAATLDVWDALARIVPDDIIAAWPDALRIDEARRDAEAALAKARGEGE